MPILLKIEQFLMSFFLDNMWASNAVVSTVSFITIFSLWNSLWFIVSYHCWINTSNGSSQQTNKSCSFGGIYFEPLDYYNLFYQSYLDQLAAFPILHKCTCNINSSNSPTAVKYHFHLIT